MSKRKRKGRRPGSSRAGRPKKAGARYPSGKLKAVGPNLTVLERRKAGDALAGEHPLDFALTQGWLTEQAHKDAMSYRAAYNQTHIGAPQLSMACLSEAPPSDQLRLNWSQLSDAEITEIFDRVFSAAPLPGEMEATDARALGRWKLLNASLSPQEREELFMVCVIGSWPFWMPKMAAGYALGEKDARKHKLLERALVAVGRTLRPPKAAGVVISPVPFKGARRERAELPVRYETTEGDEVQPESERGVPFDVSILRRRA